MCRTTLRYAALALVASCPVVLLAQPDTPTSPVQELRTQRVGDVVYFHLRLETPKDLVQSPDRGDPAPSLAPRLVAPDGGIRLVCPRTSLVRRPDELMPKDRDDKGAPVVPRQPAPVSGVEFVGRVEAKGKVMTKLLYPTESRSRRVGRLTGATPTAWKELDVTLDFAGAKEVPARAEAAQRKAKRQRGEQVPPPARDDLEGLWAAAQVDQLHDLDDSVRDFGFYGFAAATAARKYGISTAEGRSFRGFLRGNVRPDGLGDAQNRDLYETTTGAAAIAESLQLRRMTTTARHADDKRTIPVAKLRGIDIAEHPWEKMMGTKKPVPEAFAKMVPHDNYYAHFKRIAKFLEFSELLDQWGTNVTRAYEVTSRDHRLADRYHQQLCLRPTALGKTLGPLVIKGVAVTGNDAYLREGSDLAVIFEVVNHAAFLAAVEPFLAEARAKFGEQLAASKGDHHGVPVESFVTPMREVSLHRAKVGPFVVYANSPVGLRRILDTYEGRGKRLSDSLDFQYMRTVFRHDDEAEDGFAFLSDAFIRNLVGPASKIKERRRLEALTTLHMLTHGAMYTAWETGKAPVSLSGIFEATGLLKEELPVPEGKPAFWDLKNLVARSDVYNTLHFATPLIELPIADVTRTEADEYERFRLEYLGLWRQYFDPIGMRVALRDGRVKLDTYILPLIENTSYNELRRVTGQKSLRFDPSTISDKTLAQYLVRLSSDLNGRGAFINVYGRHSEALLALAWATMDPVGDWFLVRLDDSPNYEKLQRLLERQEQAREFDVEEAAKLIWTLPVAVGVDVRNPLVFAGMLASARTSVQMSLPGAVTWGPLEKEYKGISIVRVQATPAGRDQFMPRREKGAGTFLPAIYYAMIDGGFYVTLNEEMMRNLIDQATGKRDAKGTVEVATSLYVAPKAAVQAKGLLTRYLERQTRDQAAAALPIWYALYRTGIVSEKSTPDQARNEAYRYLGFVPVSPDGASYRYDRRYDEVVNERHGSARKPTPHATTAESSPLNFLVEQLRSVRADLRFREDGIHAVLTLERAGRGK